MLYVHRVQRETSRTSRGLTQGAFYAGYDRLIANRAFSCMQYL